MSSILSEFESEQLIRALLRATPAGATEADCEVLLDWAREAKIAQALLHMVLVGDVVPMVEDGTVTFRLADGGAGSSLHPKIPQRGRGIESLTTLSAERAPTPIFACTQLGDPGAGQISRTPGH